jgi:hypothetical protein
LASLGKWGKPKFQSERVDGKIVLARNEPPAWAHWQNASLPDIFATFHQQAVPWSSTAARARISALSRSRSSSHDPLKGWPAPIGRGKSACEPVAREVIHPVRSLPRLHSLVILSAAKDLIYDPACLHGHLLRGQSIPDEVLVSQDHRNGCDYYGTFAW